MAVGQPSGRSRFHLAQTAPNSGYPRVSRVEDIDRLKSAVTKVAAIRQLSFILVKAGIAPAEGIPGVSHTPEQIQNRFRVVAQA